MKFAGGDCCPQGADGDVCEPSAFKLVTGLSATWGTSAAFSRVLPRDTNSLMEAVGYEFAGQKVNVFSAGMGLICCGCAGEEPPSGYKMCLPKKPKTPVLTG